MPRRAFTILEVTLVVVILVMIAGLAYPSIEAMYADVPLHAAVDMVRARWAEARSHAIEDQRPYRFAVIPGTGDMRVAPDSPEFWGGGGSGETAPDESESPPFVAEDNLQGGVRFADASGSDSGDAGSGGGSWATVVTFDSDGTVREDVEMVLQGRATRALVLRLRAMNGAVSVQPLNTGTQP